MRKIKELNGKGFYLLEGNAAANTLLFEDLDEMRMFQVMANRYLADFMYIKEYCLRPDGWQLIVKVKDERTVEKQFEIYKSSSKCRNKTFGECWEKLSEMIRIWQNQYARWTNLKRGRRGSLFGNVYKRFYFETKDEALMRIDDLRNENIEIGQKESRFKPDRNFYDRNKEISKNEHMKSSLKVQKGVVLVQEIGLTCLFLWELSDSVVQDLVNFTFKMYNPNKSQKSTSKACK